LKKPRLASSLLLALDALAGLAAPAALDRGTTLAARLSHSCNVQLT
jgi:hypothetical protein